MRRVSFFLMAISLLICCQQEQSVQVESITIDQNDLTLEEGQYTFLTVTILPKNVTDAHVTWNSSDESIVEVYGDGRIVAKEAGVAQITAIAGKRYDGITVTVRKNEPVETIGAERISAVSALLKGKANLKKGESNDVMLAFQYSSSPSFPIEKTATVEATKKDSQYNYTAGITDLEPNSTYYYRSMIQENGIVFWGKTKYFATKNLASLLQTLDASNIGRTSVILNAKLDLTDVQYKSAEYGFYWGTSEDKLDNQITCSSLSGKTYYSSIDNLSFYTQYWYKSYVRIGPNVFYGIVKSFFTEDINATVSTLDATDIKETSAIMNGRIMATEIGSLSPIVQFWYSTSKERLEKNMEKLDIISSSGRLLIKEDGSFSWEKICESLNETIYYAAVADISGKRFFGEIKSFTYKDIDATVEAIEATEIKELEATLQGKLIVRSSSDLKKNVWFLYSDSANSLAQLKSSGQKVEAAINDDGSFSQTLKNLKYNTTYYYISAAFVGRSYEGKVFYSEVCSFTTKKISDAVQTYNATDISINSAKFRGKLLLDGYQRAGFIFMPDDGHADISYYKEKGTIVYAVQDGDTITAQVHKLKPNTTYYCIAFTEIQGKTFYPSSYPYSRFKTKEPVYSAEAVDLGLSVRWSNVNLGAVDNEDFGAYFAWGETKPKENYCWNTYRWLWGSKLTRYNTVSTEGDVDNKTDLKDYDYVDDAARATLGGKWRIPSKEEWEELVNNCTWTKIHSNEKDYYCYKVQSNIVGYTDNWIIIPFAGVCDEYKDASESSVADYWTSSIVVMKYPEVSCKRSGCFMGSLPRVSSLERYYGLPVRPVTD